MKKILILSLLALVLSSCGKASEKLPTSSASSIQEAQQASDTTDYYSISNKGSGWGFKKEVGKAPDIPAEITEMLARYDSYYMDTSGKRVLYLTFDEGYENGYTAQILDTLNEYDVPAAFFVTGSYFDREQELVKRMVDEGHIVGNHTQSHPNLHKLENPDKMKEDLKILDDKYFAAYGEHMKYMRPPEGEYSERVLAAAKDAGYKTVFWSFAYKDWERDVNRGESYAIEQITPYLHSGAVILLHAVSRDNAYALDDIIKFAKERGYEFKSLDEIN